MSPSHNILDLGLSDFNETWELQKKLQTKRILNEIEDHLLLVEHPPVYTPVSYTHLTLPTKA